MANIEHRFWTKVDKNGPVVHSELGPCWVWTSGKGRGGYGKATVAGRTVAAHRYSYAVTYGSIPDGFFVCHRCDNPPCVNPEHLFVGTSLDNVTDMVNKGRHAHGDTQGFRLHPESRPMGTKNGRAKLTDDDVCAIRECYAVGGITLRSIASRYGVSKSLVSMIVRREKWVHL